MRWRICLYEFDFDVRYKKCHLNTQADDLSRLRSLGVTIVRDGMEDFNGELALTTGTSPSFISITTEEISLSQDQNEFCCTIRACLGEEERVPIALSKDNVLFALLTDFNRW